MRKGWIIALFGYLLFIAVCGVFAIQIREDSMAVVQSVKPSTQIIADFGEHPTCIPIDALHFDESEAFVFVEFEKESYFGKTLVARQVNVTVKAVDDKYAALADGSLSKTQSVIVQADKAIVDGIAIRHETDSESQYESQS